MIETILGSPISLGLFIVGLVVGAIIGLAVKNYFKNKYGFYKNTNT